MLRLFQYVVVDQKGKVYDGLVLPDSSKTLSDMLTFELSKKTNLPPNIIKHSVDEGILKVLICKYIEDIQGKRILLIDR